MDVSEIREVFTIEPVVSKKYDVEHFIPWSFVMNDELWNLMPMDSSKSNNEEEFRNILQKNMQPVYDSAKRQGYEVWNRG